LRAEKERKINKMLRKLCEKFARALDGRMCVLGECSVQAAERLWLRVLRAGETIVVGVRLQHLGPENLHGSLMYHAREYPLFKHSINQ
jgi:hypothetical protein